MVALGNPLAKFSKNRQRPIYLLFISSFVGLGIRFALQEEYDLELDMLNKTISTAFGERTYKEIDEGVFKNIGYKMINASVPIPKLRLRYHDRCVKIHNDWLDIALTSSSSVPEKLNYDDKYEYTMYGHALFSESVHKDIPPVEEVVVWKDIETRIAYINQMEPDSRDGYAIWNAMKAYPLTEMKGIVLGSRYPWLEAYAFSAGAAEITTVSTQNITIIRTQRQINYMHPLDFSADYKKYTNQFDFAASFGFIEFCGLGRFGDAADPIGDIREVLKIRCALKHDGLFFLGLPRGHDKLIYNVHRIYGQLRLAVLFTDFELLDVFRFNDPDPYKLREYDFVDSADVSYDVFVLRRL